MSLKTLSVMSGESGSERKNVLFFLFLISGMIQIFHIPISLYNLMSKVGKNLHRMSMICVGFPLG